MIIEAPYKQNDTITLKTTGGEEVVARFWESTQHEIVIQKPLVLMATPQGIGLGPWALTVNPDTKIKINKNTVVFVAKTDSDMAKQYIASTTGLSL